MNKTVFDTFVFIKSFLSLRNQCQARTIKSKIHFMALAKMNKAVLLTGDGKMLFHAEEVGDSVLFWRLILTGLCMS